MKRTSLIWLGGLAGMVGGVAYAMANLALWFSEPPFSPIIQTLDRDRTIQTLDNVFFVFLVLGALGTIASLHTLHTRELQGVAQTLVSLPAFVGMALILIGGMGDVLRPWWHFASPIWDFFYAAYLGLGVSSIRRDRSRSGDYSSASVALVVWGSAHSRKSLLRTRVTIWRALGSTGRSSLGTGGLRRLPRRATSGPAALAGAVRESRCRTP